MSATLPGARAQMRRRGWAGHKSRPGVPCPRRGFRGPAAPDQPPCSRGRGSICLGEVETLLEGTRARRRPRGKNRTEIQGLSSSSACSSIGKEPLVPLASGRARARAGRPGSGAHPPPPIRGRLRCSAQGRPAVPGAAGLAAVDHGLERPGRLDGSKKGKSRARQAVAPAQAAGQKWAICLQ